MKDKLVVLGGGGHAKVCIDIIITSGLYEIVGFLDKAKQESIQGICYLGDDTCLDELFSQGVRYAFVAIGNNRLRQKLNNNLIAHGYKLINAISLKSSISSTVKLGIGNVVMPGAIINADAVIGDGCIINTNASLDHECMISDFVHIAPGCSISGCVSIGEGTFVGTGTNIIDKIKIGSWCQIGAGSVLVSDIESNSLAYGVPARTVAKT